MKHEGNLRGIIYMLISMAGFALADTLIKIATETVAPAQVFLLMIGGSLLVFLAMGIYQKDRLLDKRALAPILLIRYLAEICGMMGMVLALSLVPLSIVGAVTQATPIVVAVAAVIFLGEKVSWRRWSAIAVGFIGVLLIIQPGSQGFDNSVLWAVLAMVALSVRDLSTRMIPAGMPSTSLASYTMLATIPAAFAWVQFEGLPVIPAQMNWTLMVSVIGLGSIGYMFLIASLRMSEVSIVTPFRYSRIIFLLLLGIVIFDERPGLLILAGAALVILSGIYMIWREQRVRQAQQTQQE